MKSIRKETKQSLLLHHKIRKACFVPINDEKNKRFKYFGVYVLQLEVDKVIQNTKRFVMSIGARTLLLLKKVEWGTLFSDAFIWLVEAFIEGFILNYSTHFLFGLKFNIWFIFAHGFLIKQGISIYKRLIINGSTPKISNKDK